MDIIKTGIGITRTFKNVNRFREILSVFARHGFDELILKTKLHLVIPNFVIPKSRVKQLLEEESEFDFWRSLGFRIRKSFEELGPSFIKVGQLLATREDIFDPAFIAQLKLLQSKAAAIPFDVAKRSIESEVGKSIDEIFNYIEEEPIGVASIGCVYKAELKNGQKVVVKVRRPDIRKNILNDFEIITYIVSRLEKASDEIKYLGVSKAISDFFKSIQLEMNFLIEANNNEKIAKNIQKFDKDNIFVIPKVYREFSSQKILVMDYIEGIPFNEITNVEVEVELKQNLEKAVRMFLRTMLTDGFFHADLHGGNFFKMEDNKIGLIDFGLVGTLNKKNRTNLIAILYALLTNNYENLVFEFLDVAEYEVIPDYEILVKDIRESLMPYIGLSVQEIDATALTHSIVSTLSKHEIYLPREWFVIFRALMTLDGTGKALKIDLNIFEVIDSELKEVVEDLISKEALMEEAAWLGRDVIGSLRVIPRHLKWMMKELSKRSYTLDVQLKDTNNEINLLMRSVYFMSLIVLTATFFASGIYVVGQTPVRSFNDIATLSYICWGLASLTFIRATMILKIR